MDRIVANWLQGSGEDAAMERQCCDICAEVFTKQWSSSAPRPPQVLVSFAVEDAKAYLRALVAQGPSAFRAAAFGFIGHGSHADDCDGFTNFCTAIVFHRLLKMAREASGDVSMSMSASLVSLFSYAARRIVAGGRRDRIIAAFEELESDSRFAGKLASIADSGFDVAVRVFVDIAGRRAASADRRRGRLFRIWRDRVAANSSLDKEFQEQWVNDTCSHATTALFPKAIARIAAFQDTRISPGAALLIAGGLSPHASQCGPWLLETKLVIPEFVRALKHLAGHNFMRDSLARGLRNGMSAIDLDRCMHELAADLAASAARHDAEFSMASSRINELLDNVDVTGVRSRSKVSMAPLRLVCATGRGAVSLLSPTLSTCDFVAEMDDSGNTISEFREFVADITEGREVAIEEVLRMTAQVCKGVRTIDQWKELLKKG